MKPAFFNRRRIERLAWLHGPYLGPIGIASVVTSAVFVLDTLPLATMLNTVLCVVRDYGDFLGSIIGVLGAYGIFSAGERRRVKAVQLELERSAVQDFISKLHTRIVSGEGASARHVLELSIQTKDRRITRWISDAVLEILSLLVASTKGEVPASRLWEVFNETADALTDWHHGVLVTSDFDAPLAIRTLARSSGRDPRAYAAEVGLSDFLRPQRLHSEKEAELFNVLIINDGLFKLIAPHLTARQFARGARRIEWKLLKARLAAAKLRLKSALAWSQPSM